MTAFKYSFSTQGPHTLYVKYADANGLESAPRSAKILVDTSAPTGSMKIQNGVRYVNSNNVTIVFDATDLTQITQMLVANDNTFTGATWKPYAPSLAWNLSPDEGEKTVYAKLKDKWGYESTVINASIILDTSDPLEPSVSLLTGSYSANKKVTLTLSAKSPLAPITQMMVSESPTFAGTLAVPYATSSSFDLSGGDGAKTIYAKFIDAAGNSSSVTSTVVTLDTTPPTTPILTNVSRRTTNATETISFSTGSIDANFTTYQAKGGQYTDWTSVATPIPFTLGTDDVWYQLQVRGKDHAGITGNSATVDLYKGNKTKLSTMDLSTNQTLSLGYSPYYLDANVTINGSTVTIEAGVLVTAKQDNGFGGGFATLRIMSGLLLINGTSSNPVTMRRDNTAVALGWGGIYLYSAGGKPRFTASYLDIEGAGNISNTWGCIGVEVHAVPAGQAPEVTLSDSRIHDCIDTNDQKKGLSIYGPTLENLPESLLGLGDSSTVLSCFEIRLE